MNKLLYHAKIFAVYALLGGIIALYLLLHAEQVSNKKTLELKDTQINQLQAQLDKASNLK